MLTNILIVLALLLVALAAYIAMQPATFRVSRAATIAAPADVIFAQVNDLHKWQAWSPWAKMDPQAVTTFAGPAMGIGSSMSWEGKKTGAGTMTITESRASEAVVFRLDFRKPFAGTNTAEFTFTPQGGKTVVSWTMSGPNTFISKAMNLFLSCDKMVGGYFEEGLGDLKKLAEASPTK